MRTLELLLAAVLLVACGPEREPIRRTFELQHVDAAEVIDHVRSSLDSASLSSTMIRVRADEPRFLTVDADPATLEKVTTTIAQLDRPQGRVILRFQVIEADGFTTADPAIAEVEEVLRDLFRFRGYRLAAEALVQTEAYGQVSQQLWSVADEPFLIMANVKRVTGRGESGTVSLDVELTARGGDLLHTSLTVPTGKTAVVGSAQGAAHSTLILVVRPEIQ